jgi:hypothetical protein
MKWLIYTIWLRHALRSRPAAEPNYVLMTGDFEETALGALCSGIFSLQSRKSKRGGAAEETFFWESRQGRALVEYVVAPLSILSAYENTVRHSRPLNPMLYQY